MWILKKLTGGTTKYLITGKNSYSVGRKSCDIKFEEDTSISRKHCTIYISNKNKCPFPINTLTGVWIVDEQSKYGTFLCKHGEWVKINPNENELLSDGSVVRFGLMENIYSVEYKPVIACVSGISTEQKREIESSLKLIDSELSNSWRRDCSLVIVREIALTVKVVLALINGVPIVLPQYVQKLVDSIRNQTPLPDRQNFLPDIKESVLKASLVSLDPKDNRKELFKGKKFLIPTKTQLDTLKEVIASAGGQVELLSSTGRWERFVEENVIVIQSPVNDTNEKFTNMFKKISAFLKNSNRRTVPESEIAQAVAYSSITKYCNPECGAFCLRKTQRQIDSGSVLVNATPEASTQIATGSCVIPSSSRYSFNDTDLEVLSEKLEEVFPKTPVARRKRIRCPEKEEAECPKAKERKKEKTSDKGDVSAKEPQAPKKSSLMEWFDSELKKQTEKKQTEKNSSADSDLFSNFNSRVDKRPRPAPSKSSGDSSEDSVEPWESSKRKFPGESCCDSRKKSRLQCLDEAADAGAVKSSPISVDVGTKEPAASREIACDDDLETFIGRADCTKATVDELYDTILSLQLVSALFVKRDKSLVEPPRVLTNIKRFKKREVSAEGGRRTALEGAEGELSGEDWVEPHFHDSRFPFLDEDDR